MLLICPSERNNVPLFFERLPLVNLPLLGQSLLEYWLSALAIQGVTKVLVLAHDRPELAREVVRAGERWGLDAAVTTESRELTPSEALLKYPSELDAVPLPESIAVLDHFPGLSEQPLFASYQSWFAALRDWMPAARTPDRVGVNESRPGVWLSCHSHIDTQAQLRAPCWIGQHVFIGAHAVIGPGAIVEDGSFVEPGAELAESWVGPHTFVGQFARIRDSLAWGDTLINWQTGSAAQIVDAFLLSPLRQPRGQHSRSWFKKLSELYGRNKGEVGLFWKHLLLHKQG
jgi:NDP-sugar pyrophosphorylase family protein